MSDPASTEIKSDSEPWSVLENLILVQAIYKCGDTNWVAIARTIKGHPQVHRSSNFFSQKSCAIQYTQLLENLEAETRSKQSRNNEVGTSTTQDISTVVKLAGQLYKQRIMEIKALIRKDEERFRALVAELDEIRQGKWDNQLAEELEKNPPEPEPEPESEAAADKAAVSFTELSEQEPEGETAMADTTTSSSLLTPSSTSLSEKQEDVSRTADAPEAEVQASVTLQEGNEDDVGELQDVEMEDVAATSLAAEIPTEPIGASTSATGSEDVDMEDVTSKESPSVTSEDAVQAVSDHSVDQSKAAEENRKPDISLTLAPSSTTSASDLSPPKVIEEGEDITPEDESKATEAKPNDLKVATKDEDKNGETIDDESKEKHKDEREKEGEDDHPDRKKLPSKDTHAEAPPEAEDSSREEDESKIKGEAATPDVDHGEDTAQEGGEEGATSADEEETASTTRSGRKPKKIKTAVPIKRKRRSGRGGIAAENEDGYNTTDSEMTDSAQTNMSDQLMRTQMDDKKWKKILMMIWQDIANHRYGAVFMQPIKEQDAPGYYYMIKRPMDLKSIKERIRDGQITNADEFHRDVLLMFMNALMYNGEDTEVYQMALAMMNEVEFIIKNFKSSQSFAPAHVPAGTIGSGNTSNSTTPTTRTAGSELLFAGSNQPSTRKRKSSGLEMTPVE